jgi:2-C-methyl-D-erythritol 4-phosphate cytidylyltransferase
VLAAVGLPELPGSGLVLLDERCPGTTAQVVRRVVASASEGAVGAVGAVAVGVRPVTDTVKAVRDGYVGPTVDRDALVAVCSPLVLPAGLAHGLGEEIPALPALVARLVREGVAVVHVEVPSSARRLADASELVLLQP